MTRAPRQLGPIEAEAPAMPPNDGVWLDNDEDARPARPKAAESNPEESVSGANGGASTNCQGGELLTKSQVLNQEVASRAEGAPKCRQDGKKEAKHLASEALGPERNRQ